MLAKAPPPREAKLTDEIVRRLPLVPKAAAGRRQYEVRDLDARGFRVVVGQAAKTFAARVEVWEGGQRKGHTDTFGRFGEVTTKDARKAAAKWIADTKSGARVAVKRGGVTLREVWERFRASPKRRGGVRQASGVEWYRVIVEDGALKRWLDEPVAKITPERVAALHSKLTREGHAYRANGVARTARALYNWARRHMDRSLLAVDVTCMVVWNPEERRQTAMSAKELGAWGAKLLGLSNPIRREFTLLTLLTGSRPTALASARWTDIDVGRRVLHVPNPKGGPRMAFDIPLSRPVLRSLVRVRRAGQVIASGSPWIFPAKSASGRLAEWKEDRDVLPKFGNDLRQTYRGLAHDAGVGELDAHILMGHRLPGVNAGYMNRGALSEAELRRKQQAISSYIVRNLRWPTDNTRG